MVIGTMAKKSKKSDIKPISRGKQISVTLRDGLAEKLDQYIEKFSIRPAVTQVVKQALLDFLQKDEGSIYCVKITEEQLKKFREWRDSPNGMPVEVDAMMAYLFQKFLENPEIIDKGKK